MDETLLDPDRWCSLSDSERRAFLARELSGREELGKMSGIEGARIDVGPIERPYDYTAVVQTDVGDLRTPLWSHARAQIFCDGSIHPANRRQLAPRLAVREAADRLRRRLAVPFALESRGLTVTLSPEEGVERVWTAERSLFRGKTSVTREDRIQNPAADLDLRDLLAHFYSGPSLRLVAEDGSAFLLPGAAEAEDGGLITLCQACGRWEEGARKECAECGSPVDVVAAVRPARR